MNLLATRLVLLLLLRAISQGGKVVYLECSRWSPDLGGRERNLTSSVPSVKTCLYLSPSSGDHMETIPNALGYGT